MGRELRPLIAGGIYHLYCRGVRRTALYRSPTDFERFLVHLESVTRRRSWRCFAYCLMPNHYHLLVETPNPDLSLGMQRLNWSYACWFNARYGYVGHAFDDRFKSKVIQRDAQLLQTARYIVMNPVRALLCENPIEWPWSSYAASVGAAPAPPWLDSTLWTGMFSSTGRVDQARTAFAEFVEGA
jgi:putative transposase